MIRAKMQSIKKLAVLGLYSVILVVGLIIVGTAALKADELPAAREATSLSDMDRIILNHNQTLSSKHVVLERGRGTRLCEAVLANISMAQTPALARGEWGLDLSPNHVLEKPNWVPVDMRQYTYVLRRLFIHDLERSISSENATRSHILETEKNNADAIASRLTKELSQEEALLEIAKIDFNGDGYVDDVFRYSSAPLVQPEHQPKIFLPGRYWRIAVDLGGAQNTDKNADYTLHRAEDYFDVFLYEKRAFLIQSRFGSIRVLKPEYYSDHQSLKPGEVLCRSAVTQ